jgi:hypothetical protein
MELMVQLSNRKRQVELGYRPSAPQDTLHGVNPVLVSVSVRPGNTCNLY